MGGKATAHQEGGVEEDEEGNIERVYDSENVKVGLYVSFWNHNNFKINIEKTR